MPKRAPTEKAVEKLKAPAKGQVDHFDRGYPGLALRIGYGGQKAWVYHCGQRPAEEAQPRGLPRHEADRGLQCAAHGVD